MHLKCLRKLVKRYQYCLPQTLNNKIKHFYTLNALNGKFQWNQNVDLNK